jgi:uncharacterized surface protein with fasciclin (FAS1) repeats
LFVVVKQKKGSSCTHCLVSQPCNPKWKFQQRLLTRTTPLPLLPLLLLLLLLLVDSSFPDVLAPIGTYNVTVCRNVTTAPSSNATTNATTTPVGVAQEAGARAQQNQTNLLANSTWVNQAAQVFPAVRTAMANLTSNARNLNGSYSIFSAIAQAAETAGNRSRDAVSASGRRLMQAMASGSANASSGNAGGSQAGVTVFAPSDKAIQTYLQQQGLTQQQFVSNQPALLQLISYHIVPTEALSAQNLASRSNGRLQTLLPNNTLSVMNVGFNVAGNNSQVVLLQDAMGTANVRDPNMTTGKVSGCDCDLEHSCAVALVPALCV